MLVLPAINEVDFESVKNRLRQVIEILKSVPETERWVQIDISDGKFTPHRLWNNVNQLPALKALIAAKSVCTESNLAVAALLARLLKRAGFRVTIQKARENGKSYANVVGIKGKGKDPLLLCSHLDTVPAGTASKWTKTGGHPWKAVVSGSKVYGLGSADDKGPLVAMVHAGSLWKASVLNRPLIVMGSFGEEHGMGGARLFVRSWKIKPRYAFVGEPTSLGITWRHKGMGAITIALRSSLTAALQTKKNDFKGKQAHSSRPWTGDNALYKAADFLAAALRKNPKLLVASIEGGVAANVIPDAASLETFSAASGPKRPAFPAGAIFTTTRAIAQEVAKLKKQKDPSIDPPVVTSNFGVARTRGNTLSVTFDFRLLPGQSIGPVHKTLSKKLPKILSKWPSIKASITVERDNPPLGTPVAHPILKLGKKMLKVSKLPLYLTTKPSCTEAGIYSNWGVPAVIFGPGDACGNIHSPNECIELSQIDKAIRFYDHLIGEYCAGGE